MSRLTTIHSTLRELRRRLVDGGLRGTLAFLARGLRAQLLKRQTLVVLCKPLDAIAVPARSGNVRLEPIERRHLPALALLNAERGDLEGDARFAADLDAGYGGFAGFHGDELIACYWWSDGSMLPHRDLRTLGLGLELGPQDAYGFDLYVHKQHRAGGTANDVLYQVETALHARGCARLWGWVVEDNRSARWTYGARGYLPMWGVERTRVLRRWRSRRAPMADPTQAERTRAERKQVAAWTSPSTSSSSSSRS